MQKQAARKGVSAMKFKPRIILVADRHGEILYPVRLPAQMMRDELGMSQRAVHRQQATRELMPREVTPVARMMPESQGFLRRAISTALRLIGVRQ